MEIRWDLLQPVDTGALVSQGFQTGASLMKGVQQNNALRAYMANPDDPQALNALSYLNPQAASALQEQRLRQRKMLQDQQDRQRGVALGELAAVDPSGAREEALKAGDFDLAKTFGELDEERQKKTADFWGKAGSVAFRLRGLGDPERQKAYWEQARPILEAQGAPAELLDKFDPTNIAQLDAAIATSQKVGDLVSQTQPKAFNVGPGEARYEQDPVTGEIKTIIAPNPGGVPFGAPAAGAPPKEALFSALIDQESGGKPGVKGPPTEYGTALGIAQTLPGTAKEMAAKLGIPWKPDLLTAKTPEAAEYQRTLGRAYFEEGWEKYGGDPEKTLMYYHGGPDEKKWGPKTRSYAHSVLAKADTGTASNEASVRAQAQAAIAAGADPQAVRARAAQMGVNL